MRIKKKEVVKSSWVIHISHPLTLIQQQIWNVLLAYAYDNLATHDVHYLDTRILFSHFEKTRNQNHILKSLKELVTAESFNIINKTNQRTSKDKFNLLANVRIEDGFCKYSFGPDLLPQLINPPMYAKINLITQCAFSSRYSLAIYELCVDYAGVDRTPDISLSELKNYLGIENHEYTIFKHFNYKVIKKVVSEVNAKSELSIAAKFGAKNGSVYVWFNIAKKKSTNVDHQKLISKTLANAPSKIIPLCPFKQLKSTGISHKTALEIIEHFTTAEIQHAFNSLRGEIKNKGALLTKMFKDKMSPDATIATNKGVATAAFDFDRNAKRIAHKQFIAEQIEVRWENLPHDRKQTLSKAFEQWVVDKEFEFTFTGARKMYHEAFLIETLFEPFERDMDQWENES